MNFFIFREIINFYIDKKNYSEALNFLELAKKNFPNNQNLIDLELVIESSINKYSQSKIINSSYWVQHIADFPATRKNYIELSKIISNSGIKHVVMQYPNRNAQELKSLLNDFDNISYVENLKNFKEALLIKKYEEIFIDRFGIDFGHFNVIGSQLIASEIISVLQKDGVFPK